MMSSINNSFASMPIEKSETNEYCISEQELQRLLTKAIDKKMVEGAHKTESKSSSACIYRVPKELRKLKKSAYTPRLVSIGPLHSKDKHILKSPVQDVKKSYANSLLNQMSKGSEERKSALLMKCVGHMRKLIDDTKRCYAEEVEDALDEEMLVIDGCFILELFYRACQAETDNTSDPIFDSILTSVYVRHDLLLLENQLPFFVLQKLFDLTVAPTKGKHPTLRDYVVAYFCGMWISESNERTPPKKSREEDEEEKKVNYQHILHILHHHYHYHRDDAVAKRFSSFSKFMRSASDLKYAGVKFVVGKKVGFRKPEGHFPSRLFHRARFEIPTLRIYDSTEPFLRNLIAFEQCCCHGGVQLYFTSYAVLMDTLINTPKDIQVLEKAGIISNHLGASEDASNLFNNLCKRIVLGKFYFAETVTDAALHSKRCCADNMADLKRQYFANPWTFIAFCAGFITFGITVLRFIHSDFHW